MPSAPTQPLRDSLTNLGTAAYHDAEVSRYVTSIMPVDSVNKEKRNMAVFRWRDRSLCRERIQLERLNAARFGRSRIFNMAFYGKGVLALRHFLATNLSKQMATHIYL